MAVSKEILERALLAVAKNASSQIENFEDACWHGSLSGEAFVKSRNAVREAEKVLDALEEIARNVEAQTGLKIDIFPPEDH